MIRAMLVDDEIGAINTLRNMLGQYCPQVQICCVALSVQEALNAASAMQPDLVFLDIQMPPLGSGFDFLDQCVPVNFGVIFTTAHPQYAISAINQVQPWSYLIKPFSVAELKSAVAVAEGKIWEQNRRTSQLQRLVVQDSRKGTLVLRAEHILYCKADGGFTDFYVLRNNSIEKITSSRNLGEYEDELPETLFCRTHHSYLVNLSYVDRFERTGRNGIIHLATNGHKAYVSVAKMDHFSQRLENYRLHFLASER